MIRQLCLSNSSFYYSMSGCNYSMSISIDYSLVPEPAIVPLNTQLAMRDAQNKMASNSSNEETTDKRWSLETENERTAKIINEP